MNVLPCIRRVGPTGDLVPARLRAVVFARIELPVLDHQLAMLAAQRRATHADRCVAGLGVPSHAVPVALVGECFIPVV